MTQTTPTDSAPTESAPSSPPTEELELQSRIDVELPEWLLVPSPGDADAHWRTAVTEVFQAVTDVDRRAEGEDRMFDDGRVLDVDQAIDSLLAFAAAADADGGDRVVASLVVPNRWPLPVVVSVGIADPDGPDLLALAGATGGLPVEPPIVDELPAELGGEGPVVTRFDLDDAGAIWASVCCVRRQDGVDTQVLWRTADLDIVAVFTPSVVALLGAVHNEWTASTTDGQAVSA